MSSIAIGARQLKINALQGRWVPVVLVVVAAAVVVAATEEVAAVAVVPAAVVVPATVVLFVVVVATVVMAAAVVLVVVVSWSLLPKQFRQSGLWSQRREIAIFATWSDHFVCHLDAWDCFCVIDLQGRTKKFCPDLM